MSFSTNVTDLAVRVGTECKSLRTLINGNALDLNALTTTAKTNLVAAVNELNAAIAAASSISDGVTDASHTWSSTKIVAAITAAINGLVGGAPGALDTLLEIVNQMAADESGVAALVATVALKAPIASPTFTGTVGGITAAMVGLGNVNNTTDANKPVSTATQTALDLKANTVDVGSTAVDYAAQFVAALV